MDDGSLVLALMFLSAIGGCCVGGCVEEGMNMRACVKHCAPYAVDETADICQCQQVSPAVVAEDCGQ